MIFPGKNYHATTAAVSAGRKPFGHDLRMEVLATIPVASFARVKLLAADFRLSISEMRQTVESLATSHGLIFLPSSDGNGKVMPPSDETLRQLIESDCLDYWKRVYHC